MNLINTLEYLVNHLSIEQNFLITHPEQQFLETPPEILSCFQSLPSNLKDKYLCLRLRKFLHDLYFLGDDLYEEISEEQPKLINNTLKGINFEFYQQLHNSNSGSGYFDEEWKITKKEKSGFLAVKKNNLTLRIKTDCHLENHLNPKKLQIGDLVSVLFPRNQIEEEFYVAIGNAGLTPLRDENKQIIEIYFNITSEGAIKIMKILTEELNRDEIPFLFKVLANPEDYRRYDSAILKLENIYYNQIRLLLQNISEQHSTDFAENIPLFTKPLAPGLSLAEEPKITLESDLPPGFSLNRFQILANALFLGWQKGLNSPDERMSLITSHFQKFNLELSRVYLNPHSLDIYEPL